MRKFLAVIALTLVVAVLGVTLAGCGYDADMKEGNLDKKRDFTIGDDGKFRILQFTDTHLISNGTNNRDDQTLKWMAEAVNEANPDLVILTGDITGNGPKMRDRGILAIANMFEEMKVYWTYSFGNHDGEWSKLGGKKDVWVGKYGSETTRVSKVNPSILDDPKYHEDEDNYLYFGDNTKGNKEIFDRLGGYEYCLAQDIDKGDEAYLEGDGRAAMGVGNYTIDLKDKAGNIIYGLIHMDTHGKMYYKHKGQDFKDASDAGYVGLTDKQIKWYEEKAAKYAAIGAKSGVFMHIPHYGFRDATEDYTEHSKDGVPQFKEKENIQEVVKDDLFEGMSFVKEEGVYACRWEDGLEGAIDKWGTTNLIAVGHDHNNCFALRRDINAKDDTNDIPNEILIAYGRCSGVNAWGRKIAIGATIYDIDFNHTEDISAMYDVSTIYPSFKYVQKFKGAEINCTDEHKNSK